MVITCMSGAQRELDEKYAQPYNAGMMLDEQLDEEMHSALFLVSAGRVGSLIFL